MEQERQISRGGQSCDYFNSFYRKYIYISNIKSYLNIFFHYDIVGVVQVRLYGPKQRIAHFHPNWSNGTAGGRGTRVLNGGRFYWEINVSQRIFGTSMMFGIGKN